MKIITTASNKPVPEPGMAQRSKALRHEVRIIGGQWKRTRLAVLDKPGLRPTPDRVRETLFNWLGQDLTGWRCIDAFAGTGALGFEAASRGAQEVLLVEQDSALVLQLKRIQTQLQASTTQVVRGDAIAALRRLAAASMDLVLLDPPFDSALFEVALATASQGLAADGFIYLEAPLEWADPDLVSVGLKVLRRLKAGSVYAHLLKRLA
jgi:16S rRNA (guanine966-N2)-methyltransferase